MIEFFESCWAWFVENRDNIVAFFTSSDFLATVVAIFTIVRSSKSTKKNTLSMDNVTAALTANNSIADDVAATKNSGELALTELKYCENKIDIVEDKLREFDIAITSKVDAMMEVMSIVYSTIKDDAIRNSVSSVLVTAKHATDASKAQLEAEVDELKAKIEELTKTTTATVNETIDEIKSKITSSKTDKKTNVNTRY